MTENTPQQRRFSIGTAIIIVLIVLAFASRLINLGDRVMSHDEVNHVVPSFDLSQGRGYRYDPVTHGPFQFHSMALSYFLLGDSDFSTRLPHALWGIFTIIFTPIFFRRYLGKWGAIAAGVLLLISPYMLFYGRYARNEIFIVAWALLIIYSILRYLEKGDQVAIILFVAANALHFTDKATSYIFAALELMFLTAYLIYRITRTRWEDATSFRNFLVGLMAGLVALGGAAGLYITQKPLATPMLVITALLALGGLAAMILSVAALLRGFGLTKLRAERSFDILFLLGSLILPLGAAVIVKAMGFNPLDYQETLPGAFFGRNLPIAVIRSGLVVVILAALGIGIGWWLKREKWLLYAAIFYTPFILLYSTFFTNGEGLAVGFMGALGYWMEQQGVQRGGQPLFYYALIQIPIYEFLPALATLTAAIIATVKKLWVAAPGEPFTSAPREDSEDNSEQPVPTVALLVFWAAGTLFAFSYAGEKMPWLTIHIALPLCLAGGWAIGWLTETADWSAWKWQQYARATLLAFFGVLAIMTARTAYRAAFINYDYPIEYLVYAHAAGDPKTLLNQIEDISERTTGSKYDIVVAYDNNVRYPYWWYLRRFPNRIDFDKNPTSDIRRAAIIVVSSENLAKVQPVVREDFYSTKLKRLWWPNQDFWNLKWSSIDSERKIALGLGTDAPPMTIGEYVSRSWKHIEPFFTNPAMRHAVWEIWFNRDFTEYAALKNSNSFTLANWSPSEDMTVYIRKDIASQIWNYGNTPITPVQTVDPYAGVTTQLQPDTFFGAPGSEPGQFQSPRMVAAARDGSLYVADSRNHRIQHFSADGKLIKAWGSFGDAAQGAPGGQFNEPWGVAVGPDGSVYVADTWNHRIQKFTAEGEFVSMWGKAGLAETPDAFYGPRSLAVDTRGNVYVVDTGNKRVVIFDGNGNFITEFGEAGIEPGKFDEPVGIAVDTSGLVYVADTWNQRVQIFSPDVTGQNFTLLRNWPVEAWYGNSIENKPFIAVDAKQNVFISDPELCRVLEFTLEGEIVRVWGQCSSGADGFGLPSGLAIDSTGIWVADAGNNLLLHFKPEEK